MNKLTLIVFALLFPVLALSSEGTYLKYMVNSDNKAGPSLAVLGLSAGYQSDFAFLESRMEFGGYRDQSHRMGVRSSAFGFFGLGIEPEHGPLYLNFFQYVGLITNPDSILGGPFQFCEEAGIGFRDQKKKTSIGLFYRHMSSANIYLPNYGRDFFGLQMMIPW